MPSQRSLIKFITEQFSRLLRRRDIIHVARRTMPADFSMQLLKGVERERAAILERLEAIDAEISKLQALRREALQSERAAMKRQVDPAMTRQRLDGTTYTKPARDRGVGQVTTESIRAKQAERRIWRHMQAFLAEKQHRLNELGELRRLEAQTKAGNLTALVAMAERFRIPVLLGGLAERVKGPSHLWGRPSDAAGNPLPEEALDENGKPLLTGGVVGHAYDSLIVHDTPVGG